MKLVQETSSGEASWSGEYYLGGDDSTVLGCKAYLLLKELLVALKLFLSLKGL